MIAGKAFIIHENVICHHSAFFRAAFTGRFREAQNLSLTFTDTSEEVFGIFVQWLYTQTIQDSKAQLPSRELLFELWILADKILVPALQNQTIEALNELRITTSIIEISDIRHVYQNTASGSPLRRLLVDQCAYHLKPDELLDYSEIFPREFLLDITAMFLRGRGLAKKPPNMSTYYVEEDSVTVS